MQQVLAEVPGLGSAAVCRGCGKVHLNLGEMSARLSRDVFKALCRMLQEASEHELIQECPKPRYTLHFEDGNLVHH